MTRLQRTPDYQVIVPGYGMFEGPFMVSDFEFSGEMEEQMAFSATWVPTDASQLVFTPAALMLLHNAARGEVPVTIGGVDLVFAAEIGRVATLGSVLSAKGWNDLLAKMLSGEPEQIRLSIETLAVRGDAQRAIDRWDPADGDLEAYLGAVKSVFSAHVRDKPKKAAARATAKGFPWIEWQEVAFGGLRWSPQTFWSSTFVEFFAANEGLALAKGVKKRIQPPTRERNTELKAKYG